jgi:diacylglycerol kinase family enzyme
MRRNETERLCLIVNPKSGGGATGKRIEEVKAAAERWFSRFDLWETDHPGHATELATRAAGEGYDVIASVGGDGTANEVVNGLLDRDKARNPSAVFTVIPGGTGSDLIRTLQIPNDIAKGMGVAASGETRDTDAYAVEFEAHDGGRGRRYGINVTGFGVNGEVVRRANASTKRFGGTLTFLGASISSVATYVPPPVIIRWTEADGTAGSWEGPLLVAFLCNAQYCGGGMWVGRGASMDDGLFTLILVPKLPALTLLRGGGNLYTGQIEKVAGVRRILCSEVEAELLPGEGSAQPVYLDTDGEQPGLLPIRATMLPKVLRVRGLWSGSKSL